MKLLVISLLILSFLSSFSWADENLNKIKKIDQQLDTLKSLYESGVLEQTEYENSTAKLLTKKASLVEPKKKNEDTKERSTDLDKQLEVINKLYKDGVLSENDYNKTKKLLIKKSKEKKLLDTENFIAEPGTFIVNIKETHGKSYEKAELLYKGYIVSTYRPGGIKVVDPSGKTLVRITDNLKVKYFNNGESKITIKKNVLDIKLGIKGTEEGIKKTLELLKSGKKEEKKKFDKDAHKLELFIEGKKVLHYEGRYVPKHKAYFYQVLTSDFQSFHFYIRIAGKSAIALQMEGFNRKIDNAVRKAKEKLSVEFDITMEQIDDIINDRIDEEADKAVQDGIEDAISQSVSEAIQQSVGEAMSAGLVAAIEEATGEAIDDALEQELASAIDEEIARAVEMGIEEAAVTAGWQAYFDTLARGGSEAEANANAYEACGAACNNY
jgi:hypothetical protein